MKRILFSVAAALTVSLMALSGCAGDGPEQSHYPHKGDWTSSGDDDKEEKKDTSVAAPPLKILFIGNSLTVDATEFIPRLVTLAGIPDVEMTRAYHGGYTIKGYDSNYSKADWVGMRKARSGELYWRGDDSFTHSLSEIVSSDVWDIVTIQGHTGDSEVWSWNATEKSHVQGLISKIKAAHPDHVPQIGYVFSTVYAVNSDVLKNNFGNDSGNMYRTVSSVAGSICEECDIDFVIPSGTAMQNLRSSVLNLPNGQDLSRDLIHVDYGIGRYTTGCTTFKAIFEKRFGIKVEELVFRTDWACFRNGGFATAVTWENAPIALKCAEAAIEKPFELTSMASEPKGSVPDTEVPVLTEKNLAPVRFPVIFPLGYENGVYRFYTDKQATWRSEGIWFSQSQQQAYAEFEWGPRYPGETAHPFVETLATANDKGTPGFKGLWTGDYLEFRIPVADFQAGTVVNMSFPLYGRQHPAFWDIEYFDGGEWKCNRSTKTAGTYSYDCTFVAQLGSTLISHDMKFESAIPDGILRIRLKVAAGEYQNDTNSRTVVKRSMPYYNDAEAVYYSPVYFYGGAPVEELRFSIK